MQPLDIITISILLFLLILLTTAGYVELYIHNKSLLKIPTRIHVNGTRGKSSVTRLIAAGIREGGLKTYAKTTGTTPRIIDNNGNDIELHRLRSASIGEQIKLIRYFSKYKPDVLILECMAVNPQYQWVSEHKIVKSTIGVITNVSADHLDEMGTTLSDIAFSLSNTIPFNSKIITSEAKSIGPLKEVAKKRKTEIVVSDDVIEQHYMDKLPFIEHPENVSLALKVCQAVGVPKEIALKGMLKTKPDPGALFIWNIQYKRNKNKFISAFAANDPNSTMKVWNLLTKKYDNKKCVFLNTRNDRRYRTIQLIELVLKHIKPDHFIVRGDDVTSLMKTYETKKMKIKVFNMQSSQNEVIEYMNNLNNYIVVGVGNIVGWGDKFIKKIKKFKI